MSEWKIYKVKELVGLGIIERPMDGNHGEIHPKSSDFVPEGIPFIMATDIKNNKLDLKNCNFITKAQADKLRKGFSFAGDVLLTHKASIGRTAIVPTLTMEYIMLTPQVTYYRIVDTKRLNNEYLKHYFNSSIFQQTINSYANSGSTRAYIGITEQLNLPILLPPIENQLSIASILSSLDDKIELNLQMNQTLEAMAQAIFKEWFVNFNFPGFDGELVDSLPKGWKKKNLTELIDTVSKTHKFPKGEAIFLNTSDILEGEFLHNSYTVIELLPGQAKKTIQFGDILFSEIRPANKRYAFVDFESTDYVVSTKLMVLRSKGIVDNLLIYFFMKSNEVLNQLQQLAESRSGTFPQITYTELAKIEINVPSNDVLKLFTEYLWASFKKIRENQTQNQTLTQIRNSLLPKFMTGKIEIKA